eukprot:201678-Prorocentrum_lima.AAC.1
MLITPDVVAAATALVEAGAFSAFSVATESESPERFLDVVVSDANSALQECLLWFAEVYWAVCVKETFGTPAGS